MDSDLTNQEDITKLSLTELLDIRNYAVEISAIEEEINHSNKTDPNFWLNFISICDDELRQRAEQFAASYQSKSQPRNKNSFHATDK